MQQVQLGQCSAEHFLSNARCNFVGFYVNFMRESTVSTVQIIWEVYHKQFCQLTEPTVASAGQKSTNRHALCQVLI